MRKNHRKQFAHLKRKQLNSKLRDNLKLCYEIHTSSLQFIKLALQFMFFANGGAALILLQKNIELFMVPIVIFGFGICTVTISAFLVYIRGNTALLSSFNDHNDPLKNWYELLQLKIIGIIICTISCVIFLFGLYCAYELYQ